MLVLLIIIIIGRKKGQNEACFLLRKFYYHLDRKLESYFWHKIDSITSSSHEYQNQFEI